MTHLSQLRHNKPFSSSTLKIICSIGFLLSFLLLTGCQLTSEPEKAYKRFQKAVSQNKPKLAWMFLSTQTQKHFNSFANKHKLQTGLDFFGSLLVTADLRLRPSPTRRHKVGKEKATLFYRDELEQPVKIRCVKENKKWKLVLTGRFLSSFPKKSKKASPKPTPKREEPFSRDSTPPKKAENPKPQERSHRD